MEAFTLYLLLTLPAVGTVLSLLSVLLLIGCCAAWLGYRISIADARSSSYDKSEAITRWEKELREWTGRAKYAICGILIGALIPTTKTMLFVIAWYLGNSIDGIENLPENMVDYLNTLMENEIKELVGGEE